MIFLLDHENYFERFSDYFYVKNLRAVAQGCFFCHENAKQTPQHLLADAIEAFLMISEKACIH